MTQPAERDLGGLATSALDDHETQHYEFFRIDMPAPNGTIRLTTKPGGYVGQIDEAGVQTWLHSKITFSGLKWAQQKPTDVAWVELWDLDNVWSVLLLNYDIEDRPVSLWKIWFDLTTGAVTGKPHLWRGKSDVATRTPGGQMRLSLVPQRSQLSSKAPFIAILPTCQNVFGDPFSCKYRVLTSPAAPTPVDSTTGGINPGTYGYRISAVGMGGETLAGTGGSVVVSLTSRKITVTWPAVADAFQYNVYGRTVGSELLMATVDAPTTTWIDTGVVTPSGALPGANTTGQQTDCDHSTGACNIRFNRLNFVGWEEAPSKPVIWNQITTT